MTNDYVVLAHLSYNLDDALEELSSLSRMLQPNVEIDEEEFRVRMAHLYWHLNSAWNSRNLSADELQAADHDRMNEFGGFPDDLEPL